MDKNDLTNADLPTALFFGLEIVQLHQIKIVFNKTGIDITDAFPPLLIQFDKYSARGSESQEVRLPETKHMLIAYYLEIG